MTQAPVNGNEPFEAAVGYSESSSWNMNEFDLADQEFPMYDCAPPDFSTRNSLNTVFTEFDNIDWVSREPLLIC